MSGTGLLGDFEQLVLLALLGNRDHGYAIVLRKAIEDATRRSVSRGALYRTLDRMAEKGLVGVSFEEPTANRGGHARKRFLITPEGVAALRRTRAVVSRLSSGLEDELEALS